MSRRGMIVLSLALGAVSAAPQPAQAAAYMRVVSWNLRHAGWPDNMNYAGYANQIWRQYGSSSTSTNGCDLVLAQEVMNTTAASSIASQLTSVSGFVWAYAASPLIGRSASYKEMYVAFYRTDRVAILSNTVYNDVGDVFEREPQIVRVRDLSTSADFTFINWHAIYGTVAERQAEVRAIAQVFSSVQNSNSTDQDVILVGDHNVDGNDSNWSDLKALSPQVVNLYNPLTTLNSSGGFVSAYDHFWLQQTYVTEYSNSGRDYIADTLSFYNTISDHAPGWIRFYSTGDTD